MSAAELTALSLSEAAALVKRREVSPIELADACIARAEALEPKLNAYLTRTFETAQAEAKAAALEIGGGKYRGPLHGIPFALKDLYETAGVRTTAGSPVRESFVPAEDAHTVAKLKEAGVVMLGKLALHEWAMGGTNVNEFFGTPHNPWDLSRITGGSSGGSGAAVAAGLCYGSLGSDTRGSIRIPAAACGIAGIKPTYGRVSLRGVVPLTWSLDHPGPMARTVEDCAAILQAIAGWDPRDPTSADVPVPDYSAALRTDVRGLRIGVPRNFFFDAGVVEGEVRETVLATRRVFQDLGAEIRDVEFPGPLELDLNNALGADAAAYHEEHVRDAPEKISEAIRTRLQQGQSITGMAYSRERFAQLEFQQKVRVLFKEVDLVLTPTSPVIAPRIADSQPAATNILARNTSPSNIAAIPTISLPCGFSSEGMPIGLQLAGRWWDEETVLRAGYAYQQATDWHKRRPPL